MPNPPVTDSSWLRMKDLPWRARPATATTATGVGTARSASSAAPQQWKRPLPASNVMSSIARPAMVWRCLLLAALLRV
jgi:hypothetical protein